MKCSVLGRRSSPLRLTYVGSIEGLIIIISFAFLVLLALGHFLTFLPPLPEELTPPSNVKGPSNIHKKGAFRVKCTTVYKPGD